jgi:hypothetical protein
MTPRQDFDRLLGDWLDAEGPHDVPAGIVDAALAEASRVPQARDWLGRLPLAGPAWPSGSPARARRVSLALLLVGLLAALAFGALVAGQLDRQPTLGRPGLIAFSVEGRLMMANPDGAEARRVPGGGTVSHDPVWSPDGRKLAFLTAGSWEDPRRDLIVTDVESGEARVVARSIPNAGYPSWSSDSRSITFGADDRVGPIPSRIIYVVDVETGTLRPVPTPDLIAYDPSFSPSENLILFFGHGFDPQNGLYVIRPDGSGLRRITHAVVDDYYLRSFNHPSWSPDGRLVAYYVGTDRQHDIWVASIDGTLEHDVSNHPADEQYVNWSPDGSRLAWLRIRDAGLQLIVSDPDGLSQVVASGSYPITEAVPQWSPDGSGVMVPIFDVASGRADRLGVFDPDGIDPPTFLALHGDNASDPSWQRKP